MLFRSAAVLCLTESLYTHLQMAGSNVKAHVLFPAGFLNTGIWESWRHRPDQYAPTQQRRTPEQTLGAVMDRFDRAGMKVQFTPLENVAAQVIDGIVEDRFWMMGPPSPGDEVITKKAASIISRTNPDYLVDTLSQRAADEKGDSK